jgi:CDP-alcohol phosphatidyltransferase
MSCIRSVVRTVTSKDNVYTLRLWDWIFPGLFVPLRGRRWARVIPNALTYSRLVLSPPVLLWLAALELGSGGSVLAAAAALVAIIGLRLTDILDGRAARELDLVSDRGSRLDPLADGWRCRSQSPS